MIVSEDLQIPDSVSPMLCDAIEQHTQRTPPDPSRSPPFGSTNGSAKARRLPHLGPQDAGALGPRGDCDLAEISAHSSKFSGSFLRSAFRSWPAMHMEITRNYTGVCDSKPQGHYPFALDLSSNGSDPDTLFCHLFAGQQHQARANLCSVDSESRDGSHVFGAIVDRELSCRSRA
jgi:hypothetical protein